MRRKWKIGLVLLGVAAAAGVFWCWPSYEPSYEGKRLSLWLDEAMRLSPYLDTTAGTNQKSVARIAKAVQAIGTNAIPFLLRDMEKKKEPRWLESLKTRAYRMRVLDQTHFWRYRVGRSIWGFQALGTNGAPALERLMVLHDGDSEVVGGAQWAVSALGPVAVPELEKRLQATNGALRRRAAGTLAYIGPAAEPVIPSLLALLNDSNIEVRGNAVAALSCIGRQPERLMPLFRGLLSDSNVPIRIYAAGGLGRFGVSAKAAIPDLVQATNDPDPNVVIWVRRALEQIESEASSAAPR